MDKLIYTAMTGASHVLNKQASVSQNLANSSTPGYRSVSNAFRAVPLVGEGLPTRTFVVDSVTGYDATPGSIQTTGRALDVAVNGKGWIAVQASNGEEAYTRNGSLQITPEGTLQTSGGLAVMGDAGPISVPQDTEVSIANDGTISAVPSGSKPSQALTLGRLKLVNPPETQMVRGDDGLFRQIGGTPAETDPNVRVAGGSLESSNVNAVQAMVDMISLARQFDMQMRMLTTAKDDAQQASQILNVAG
jgi:flagellar basal-body rod protein FlgF